MERNPREGVIETPQNLEQQVVTSSDGSSDQITAAGYIDTGFAYEGESTDERLIREGIERAAAEERSIDNRTARHIASQLHGGQASALYSLASTGNIAEGVDSELSGERPFQPRIVQDWIDHLTAYCASRPDRGPVEGWNEVAQWQEAWERAGVDRRQIDALDPSHVERDDQAGEAEGRANLMRRISPAGVSTLGQIATVSSGSIGETDTSESDTFSWGDAARWQPAEVAASEYENPQYSAEELDMLFSEETDEEVGTTEELGWFGLVRHEGSAGGVVLSLDEQGFKHVWGTDSDDALTARWAEVTKEYERFHEEREAYELAIRERDDAPSGINPQIWVGSLSDYNNGELYGVWMDATLEPDELHAAIRFMLRKSPSPDAEEWAVMDYNDFGGTSIASELGEWPSMKNLSMVAKGLAEHGPAFGEWAAIVGAESEEAIQDYGDHFRGEWESFEAYIKDYLEETEFYQFLEYVPEDMRGYVEVDIEQIARDWGSDYDVVEKPNGGVWVFDPRM